MLAAIERGDDADDLRPWFTSVVSDHHLSYGHGAIYTQKAFELLDMIGWERAATVLPYLVPTLVYGTREDKLPYMRPFMKALAGVDLAAVADVAPVDGWSDDGTLLAALLGDRRTAPVEATVAALRSGASVDDVLDVVVQAVSERMLRYDVAGEFDFADDFGWLDITHGLTYANAVRWHHANAVDGGGVTSPDMLRLVLFTTFLAQWTGRHEWHTRVGERHEIEPLSPRPRHLRCRTPAPIAARRDDGVHRPRPRRQDVASGGDRVGAFGLDARARRDRPIHRRARSSNASSPPPSLARSTSSTGAPSATDTSFA